MHYGRRTVLKGAAATAAATAAGAATTAAGAKTAAAMSYRDPTAAVASRVQDLLSRMTLEEKAAQLLCMWERKTSFLDEHQRFSPAKAASVLQHGIGHIARPTDVRGTPEWELHPFRSFEDGARVVNQIQRFLLEKTRLGIPALLHDELAHGLLAGEATIFPSPPALGSTWDPALVEEVFTVAAREARVRGTCLALTPVIDLIRDPRWGRVEEMFGEDAHLVAAMGVAAVRGLQGRSRPLAPDRVFATLKHFVHGSPQGGLNTAPADMSDRTLRSLYLVPFARIIALADPAVIMPSYNSLQGIPAHASVGLLQTLGRRELGFKGAYFSDYSGIANLKAQHHVTDKLDDAAVLAMNAGVGADFPEGDSYRRLPDLVRAGRVTEAQLDEAVGRVLALKFEAGLFENPYVDLARIRKVTAAPAHVALARTAAERAIVLLKNDGVLPLEPKGDYRLAVIGPNSREAINGGYSGSTVRSVGILEGLRRGAPANVRIDQADGVWITAPDALGLHRSYSAAPAVPDADNRRRIAEAVALASRSDAVVLVLGDVPAVTREAVDITLPGDRSALGLWGMQDELVEALLATGKPLIATLINGRPLAVNRLAEKANALLEGWYLGEQGGNALADVLFGRVNPGGKLPMTFPRSAGDLPVWYDREPSADNNRYVEGERGILFPFGHGLSYTRFEIAAPELASPAIGRSDSVRVAVRVRNIGRRAGDEVVQLYIRDTVSSVPRPILELRHFRRITLAPGEEQVVEFTLTPDDLALWDTDMKRTVEPGEFLVLAGASSASLRSATLVVS